MKESKHNIDYFLTNPNFISWVNNPDGNNDIFWKKWLKNHPESKETFYDAKAVLQRTTYRTVNIPQSRKEEILDNILKDTKSPRYAREGNFWGRAIELRPWLIGSAAVLSFLLVSLFFRDNLSADSSGSVVQIITKYAPPGKKISFYLPDSTFVTMNSGSPLKYPTFFAGDGREVILTGEAYFDVRHNAHKNFLVRSGDIVTKVHGTAFNVKAYNGETPIHVSLERGSVSVHSQLDILKKVSYQIVPGEKLTVNEDFGQSIISVFDPESEFGWKDGILIFKDSDLDDFITLMERWYGIDILLVGKNEGIWAINGSFKQESLESVLKSLEFSREVAYKIQDKQVTLYLNNN